MGLFPRRDIRDPERGHLYLQRWTLLRLPGCKLMLHRILEPDFARDPHDHPWPFATLVLRGGYREHVYLGRDRWHQRVNAPGRIRFCGRSHRHYVGELLDGPAWTLVLRGPRRGPWGFFTKCGWVHWQAYVEQLKRGAPVCEEDTEHGEPNAGAMLGKAPRPAMRKTARTEVLERMEETA